MVTECLVEEFLARDDLLRILHEKLQYFEFLRGSPRRSRRMLPHRGRPIYLSVYRIAACTRASNSLGLKGLVT